MSSDEANQHARRQMGSWAVSVLRVKLVRISVTGRDSQLLHLPNERIAIALARMADTCEVVAVVIDKGLAC